MTENLPPPRSFSRLARRDFLVAARRASWLNPIVFLAVILSLVSLTVRMDASLGAQLAPALLWTGLLLASQLGLEAIFGEDLTDGSLEQMFACRSGLLADSGAVLSRLLAYWVSVGLPLCLAAALFCWPLGLPLHALPAVAATLPFGMLALILLGGLGSALALGRGGLLAGLLSAPLALPVLIFAVSATIEALNGGLWWQGAGRLWLLTLLLLLVLPVAIVGTLRLHLE